MTRLRDRGAEPLNHAAIAVYAGLGLFWALAVGLLVWAIGEGLVR